MRQQPEILVKQHHLWLCCGKRLYGNAWVVGHSEMFSDGQIRNILSLGATQLRMELWVYFMLIFFCQSQACLWENG